MLYIFAIFLLFLTFGVCSWFQKKHNTRMGHGIGVLNSQEWGMEREDPIYHE